MDKEKLDYRALFQSGVIATWYLKDSQLELYRMLLDKKKVVARCHRRYGKGTTVFVYVFERCLKEKIIVRYGTDTQTHAHSIFEYLMEKIFEKCPEMKPKKRDNYYLFPSSGSRIYLFGVKDSGELDKARGEEAHIIIADEYGFWKFRAQYVLESVLGPQVDDTDGQIIITSTPPEDMTHDFTSQIALAEIEGYLFHWDINQSIDIGEISDSRHRRIINRCGIEGVESIAYKREYLCQMIANAERLVIPEGQNEELYVGKQDRPAYYDYYVCMDLGLRDHTAVLFAYLDFAESRLVVETEYVVNYTSTKEIVTQCKEIERKQGLSTFEKKDFMGRVIDKAPYRRIGDCEMQQLWDMSQDHGYPVTAITKRTTQSGKGFCDSVLNKLRMGIQEGRVLISPKCPKLRTQIKYGIWNEKRTDFQRTEALGHLDALMSLAYLFDNIDWQHNPFPHKSAGMDTYSTHFSEKVKKELGTTTTLGRLIGK